MNREGVTFKAFGVRFGKHNGRYLSHEASAVCSCRAVWASDGRHEINYCAIHTRLNPSKRVVNAIMAELERHAAPPLVNAMGEVVRMEPGPCLWCGEWVEVGRERAGSTNPYDPAWNADGDFGCDSSPETNSEGVGDHARPYDLARMILEQNPV